MSSNPEVSLLLPILEQEKTITSLAFSKSSVQQQKRIPYKILERSKRRYIAIHSSKKYEREINLR